jgi:hypothetical protein
MMRPLRRPQRLSTTNGRPWRCDWSPPLNAMQMQFPRRGAKRPCEAAARAFHGEWDAAKVHLAHPLAAFISRTVECLEVEAVL